MSLLNWNDKKNSAALADFIAKYGAEYCMTAEEINEMRDAVNEMAVVQQSTFMGTVIPANTPSGTGNRFWFTVTPGTYTNHGGVVVSANSLAIISVIGTVWSISQTALELTEYARVIDVAKKANLQVGKNLFNKVTTTDGYYLSNTNGIIALAGFCYSDYIAVIPGQSYKPSVSLRFTTFYDANKIYIAGGNNGESSATFVIPAGVYFLRFTLSSLALKDTCQLELGTVSTTYSAYKLVVSASELELPEYTKTADLPAIIAPLIASKADLVVGKNLFNYLDSDVKRGFYINSVGGTNANSPSFNLFTVTGFMPVVVGQSYFSNRNGSGVYNAFYDSNKVFISSYATNTAVAPVNAVFMRNTVTIAAVDDIATQTVQIEKGTSGTTYEPYVLQVPNSQLNLSRYTKTEDLPSVTTPIVNSLIVNKADLVVGKNLFNKDALGILNGKYIGTSGSQNTNSSYFISDYIQVLPSTTYVHSNFSMGSALSAIYDVNKVFISTFNSTTITIPSNGYYVRMSGIIANKLIQQFELGTMATTYESYKLLLNPNQIVFPPQGAYNNKIACPLKQHFLSTIENNIYLDEFQKRKLQTFPISTIPTIGTRKNDFIRATNPAIGTYSINNALVDLDYVDVMRKDYFIVVSNLSKTTPISVLSVGDSYTDIGTYVKKISATIPNITHVGMCKSVAGTDVKREGRTGWTLNLYATELGKNTENRFFSPFLHPVAPYTYYGNTALWQKVYIGTAPDYEIASFVPWLTTLNINSSGVRATPAVNDVMYFNVDSAFKYWNGSAWTVITESSLGFTFNFAKYLSTWNIPTPDVITVLLGMNDFRSQSLSTFSTFFVTWKSQIDSFIASAKLANANIKIVIATCNSTEYNDLSGKANAALWEGYNAVITAYDNREAENIFISDTKVAVDRVYGYSGTKAIPFSNYTGSETIWYTGGDVHLNTGGMNQIGEKLAATIQYARP